MEAGSRRGMSIGEPRVRMLVMLALFGYSAPLRERWDEEGHENRYRGYLEDPRHARETVDVNDEEAVEALARAIVLHAPARAALMAAE